MKHVLVVPSGTEIAFEIHDALTRRRDVVLFGAESTTNSHAALVFERNYRVPRCDEPGFIDAIHALITEHGIDYIFPAHDDVQLALLEAADSLRCRVLSSPLSTVEVTRFKSRTYGRLAGAVPTPAVIPQDGVNTHDFPVFVKPDRGQGSLHAVRCDTRSQLEAALKLSNDMLAMEYLPGEEVTVDCFSDRDRGVLYAAARKRLRTRAGISVRAESYEMPEAMQYARAISGRFRLYGAWFFQCKQRASGEWALMEVGARISGGATYARMCGVNLPLLTLFEFERAAVDVAAVENGTVLMDRAFISRFRSKFEYDTLYVDFDDTLVLKGTPNFELVALLVAARHYGKRVELLTRNDGWCHEWLERYALTGLFDRITTLNRVVSKADYIEPKGLLIDDSFAERKSCREAGIACVDVDAVRTLLEHLQRG